MQYSFYGGVRPPSFKTLTSDRPIKRPFMPKRVVLPLIQHVGVAAEPVVAVGEEVKVGKVIARAGGFISSCIHASLSGKITDIGFAAAPNKARTRSITIESALGGDQEFRAHEAKDVTNFSRFELLDMIKDAGIVGLGGAAFPTHVKLSPPKNKIIDTLIVNGAECEPYITCDHRIMLEKSKEVLRGIDIAVKILDAKEAHVAIEDNKLSAIYAMERALVFMKERGQSARTKIVPLRTKYPQGAEKQAIKAILNRVVPAQGLPMDVGCVVLNVGTVYAIYEAVYLAKPLIERVVTITGSCIKEPLNAWVRVGTLASDLIAHFGPLIKDPAKIIAGGPMMGTAQFTLDIPVTKGTGAIMLLSKEEVLNDKESVCIRCGLCLDACPMRLVPTSLMHRVKKENFTEAESMGIANCYECGSCAYVCPAKIPLLDYMKYGKAKILTV